MKKNILRFVVITLITNTILLSISNIAKGNTESNILLKENEYLKDSVLIKVNESNDKEATKEIIEKYDVINELEKIQLGNNIEEKLENEINGTWYKATLKKEVNMDSLINKLEKDNSIEVAEPDYIRSIDESSINITNNKSNIMMEDTLKAWRYLENNGLEAGGSKSVTVAIIDTGVDYKHKDLKNSIWINEKEIPENDLDDDGNGYIDDYYGVNTSSDMGDNIDLNGHGTHVAGIIASEGIENNSPKGIANNARIMAIKANIGSTAILTSSSIAKAITYAAENGADVINMSFGGVGYSKIEEDAMRLAFNSTVLVAAAGNEGIPNELGKNSARYPAAYPWVIGVMSSANEANSNNEWLSRFSNWDNNLRNSVEYEVMAPGENIYSTLPNDRYGTLSGTSMSTPIVSAMAALIRTKYKDKSVYPTRFVMGQVIETGIELPGKTIGDNNVIYYKAINIYNSLTTAAKPNVTYLNSYLLEKRDDNYIKISGNEVYRGETIDIAMVLKNHWGIANEVECSLEVLDKEKYGKYISVVNSTVEYKSMGAFAIDDNGITIKDEKIVNVNKPFTIKISDDAPEDVIVNLKVKIKYKNAIGNDNNIYENIDNINLKIKPGTRGEDKENAALIESLYNDSSAVEGVSFLNSSGNKVNIANEELINVHIKFKNDMDITIDPIVTLGPDYPVTDYRVKPIDKTGWISNREWVGQINITKYIGDGYQFINIMRAKDINGSNVEINKLDFNNYIRVVTYGVEEYVKEAIVQVFKDKEGMSISNSSRSVEISDENGVGVVEVVPTNENQIIDENFYGELNREISSLNSKIARERNDVISNNIEIKKEESKEKLGLITSKNVDNYKDNIYGWVSILIITIGVILIVNKFNKNREY